jgi:hypothetical protein
VCGGQPSYRIAFLKNALAAATSRVRLSLKSTVCPALSTAPIQIGPLSAHLEMGFIDSPRAASAAAKAIPPLDEHWRIPSNPAQDRRVRQLNSAFRHHFDQVPRTQFVSEVPAHTKHNDFRSKCRPLKQIKRSHLQSLSPSTLSLGGVCTRTIGSNLVNRT